MSDELRMGKWLAALLLALFCTTGVLAQQGDEGGEGDSLSLITDTPDEGYELAVSLARRGVSTTQTDRSVLMALRQDYANDADALIASSHVIAVHFQTIAAANNYWRD